MGSNGVAEPKGHRLTRCPNIELILDTPKGRGVFATTFIPKGTILETCPVLVLDVDENKEHVAKTELYHYTYNWPLPPSPSDTTKKPRMTQAVVLGLGSMFNHSTQDQNVGWKADTTHQIMTYHALRDIQPGEELCISYGSHLTFVDADAPSPVDEGDGTQMLNHIELG
ncbi:hypothetical protein KVT40_007673 [Elsinoe batatas]|uniref:SET domain-containing protein n=1 Tax=Elsinoe batatas TaxID=2601811 RepID=A0A8K0KZ10_9PEZI|nr:hypothetical protein KVT40_007673 [Elsinoe batatas]